MMPSQGERLKIAETPEDRMAEALAALERECQRAERAWQQAAGEAREHKRIFDKAVEDLRKKVRELGQDPLPLWTAAGSAAVRNLQEPGENHAPVDSPPAEDDSWKRVPLAEIGLLPNMLQSLIDADLHTAGDLAMFLIYRKLTDLRGIGQAKAQTIKNSLAYFRRQRQGQEAVDEHIPEEESDETE